MIYKKYSKLLLNEEYRKSIEKALDEADKEAENPNTKYLTHEEIFNKLRRNLDE